MPVSCKIAVVTDNNNTPCLEKNVPLYLRIYLSYLLVDFYSAAALLAMQRAVIDTAIPSVRQSVRLSVCHMLVPYPDE